VTRVAASSPHTPISTATTVPVRQTVNPPGSSNATGWPNSVRMAGFAASAASDAASRLSPTVLR
jgi:hypothetical protein